MNYKLKHMKNEFFKNISDDVLPPSPYYIGKQQFNDYTIYQQHLQPIKQLYNKLYGYKSCKTIHGLAESESPKSQLG